MAQTLFVIMMDTDRAVRLSIEKGVEELFSKNNTGAFVMQAFFNPALEEGVDLNEVLTDLREKIAEKKA